MKKRINSAHILFEKHLTEAGFYFIREYKFDQTRKWKADYFISSDTDFMKMPRVVADTLIEIEGGLWMQGRHSRGKGYQGDLDKYNAATAKGFKVYRFSTQDVMTGKAKAFVVEHCQ